MDNRDDLDFQPIFDAEEIGCVISKYNPLWINDTCFVASFTHKEFNKLQFNLQIMDRELSSCEGLSVLRVETMTQTDTDVTYIGHIVVLLSSALASQFDAMRNDVL